MYLKYQVELCPTNQFSGNLDFLVDSAMYDSILDQEFPR